MKRSLLIAFVLIVTLAACKEIAPPACEELKQGVVNISNSTDTTYVIQHYIDTNITWITLTAGQQATRDVPAGTFKFIAKGKKRKEQITTVPQCGNASWEIN